LLAIDWTILAFPTFSAIYKRTLNYEASAKRTGPSILL